MYKILVSDKLAPAGLERLREMDDVELGLIGGATKEELIAAIADYDAIIIRSDVRLDEPIITAGAKLKVIGRAGVGVDNVDVEAASRHKVLVMNTPQANSIATAEQTMALMLAVCRHTVPAHNALTAGEWQRSRFVGVELYGKTLGIIGLGQVGRLVAGRAKAFGMEVIAFSRTQRTEAAVEAGVDLVPLPELLARSDIISLHTRATTETANMIDRATLNHMKDGVVIVNVARGNLVDEDALAEALGSGKVAAAALDVFQQEPPLNSPLIGLPNVLHTPHLGASSEEAQRRVAVEIVEQVVDALRGVSFRNVVNSQAAQG